MHKINVLAFGSENFNTSLEELKDYLNFKLTITNDNLENQSFENYDVLFIHADYLKDDLVKKELLQQSNKIKILASNSNDIISGIFTDTLFLPTQIKDLNKIIEDSVIKKSFSKNSSIKIKDYILDKNEKKLIKDQNYILLTEKEIQLLELFLGKTQSISKNKILEKVWKYSTEADTHTVETHIYRLRKKIKSKFSDDSFILNDKNGYLLWKKEISSQKIFLQPSTEKELWSQKRVKVALKERRINSAYNLAPIFWIIFEDISVPFSKFFCKDKLFT